jgi:hypothetical protein
MRSSRLIRESYRDARRGRGRAIPRRAACIDAAAACLQAIAGPRVLYLKK